MTVSDELVKAKDIITHVLETQPETRDDDTLLLVRCWKHQGVSMPGHFEDEVREKGLKPESVRRIRQMLQAASKYRGIKWSKRERMAEAEKIREWAKGGNGHADEDEKKRETVQGSQGAEGFAGNAPAG